MTNWPTKSSTRQNWWATIRLATSKWNQIALRPFLKKKKKKRKKRNRNKSECSVRVARNFKSALADISIFRSRPQREREFYRSGAKTGRNNGAMNRRVSPSWSICRSMFLETFRYSRVSIRYSSNEGKKGRGCCIERLSSQASWSWYVRVFVWFCSIWTNSVQIYASVTIANIRYANIMQVNYR